MDVGSMLLEDEEDVVKQFRSILPDKFDEHDQESMDDAANLITFLVK